MAKAALDPRCPQCGHNLSRVFADRLLGLRRQQDLARPAHPPLVLGPLRIDIAQHEVTVSGRPVRATATQFQLLLTLARQPGRVFSRKQLLEASRGTETTTLERSIDAHLSRLRRSLGKAGGRIQTVHGVGYRFGKTGK